MCGGSCDLPVGYTQGLRSGNSGVAAGAVSTTGCSVSIISDTRHSDAVPGLKGWRQSTGARSLGALQASPFAAHYNSELIICHPDLRIPCIAQGRGPWLRSVSPRISSGLSCSYGDLDVTCQFTNPL